MATDQNFANFVVEQIRNLFKVFVCLLALTLSSCSEKEQAPIRFAFLTDLHVQPDAESSLQLQEIVHEINTSDLDFVVVTGDICNRGTLRELANVKQILDQLTIPYFMVPGNHETNWSESAGQDFVDLWGDDKFLFRRGKYVFLGLSTGPLMRMGDGHILTEDLRWLDRQLARHMKPGKRLLFFSHYPLAEGLDEWYLVTDRLNEYPGVVAFCGHGHRQQLLNFDGIPGIMGRSMVLRGGDVPGYNIVEIRNDSLFVLEKETGQPAQSPFVALSFSNLIIPDDLASSPKPDFSVNESFPFVTPVFSFTDTSSVFTAPLVVGDTMVVFGNAAGVLRTVLVADTSIVWEQQLAGPLFGNPVLHHNHIIMGDAEGILRALEISTGRLVWQTTLGKPIVAPALTDENHIFVGAGIHGMYALKAETGNILWHFDQAEGLIQTAPVLHNNHLVFTAWDTHVYALHRDTGKLLWKWNNQRPVTLFSPGNVVPAISNNRVFVVAPDRYMTALDLKTGRTLWRSNKHVVRESMGLSYDGSMVFAKTMNDTIVAVSTKTEEMKTLWAVDAGYGYDHNPAPVISNPEMLFAATRNGLIMALDQDGKLHWKHKTGNAAVNFLRLDGEGRLWFTTTPGHVIALDF